MNLRSFWNYRDELSILDGLILKGTRIVIPNDVRKLPRTLQKESKDPSIPREIPLVPWTLLEIDIFTCEDHQFLHVVDVSYKFPVVRILPNETTRTVLNALKGVYIVILDCPKEC